MGQSGQQGAAGTRNRDRQTGWLVTGGVLILALALRALAFAPLDLLHPDELAQYLEQANRLATGHGLLPWETRFGIRNELIPQLLCLPMWIAHRLAPGTLAPMYAARICYAVLTLLALPAAWRLGALTSRRHALVAMFVVATWWQSVLFSDLLLSESLAAALILLAAAPLLDSAAGRAAITGSGFLLGIGLLVRFQFAPFVAVLALSALFADVRRWKPLAIGGIAALAIGAASDLARGAVPFGWVIANLTKNIGEGKAAGFGTSGPLEYLFEFYRHFGAAPLLFAVIAVVPAARRYAPLLLAAALTVAAHSLIAHKEYRFVWIATLGTLTIAGIGSLTLVDWLLRNRTAGRRDTLPLAATMAIWALLSFASFATTGGYRSMRGGGGLSELAIAAARDPRVCRLAVAESYYLYVVPSILPRDLPISVAPKGVQEGRKPLPPGLARAANALLAGSERPRGAEGYEKIACRQLPKEQPCLYLRPGSCTPDPVYNLQSSIERAGL
ncbi:hypothetical protein [Novosphingobium sp. ST904]|uniref:hypothetical protein n=1 Tax=Novosphingobium sp. ST904 TaxID=1684385 RepID=UPI0006C8DDD9|nr:hypothetical protein [Novosphingobium sp. ST904]KPH57615.1 hypothetical protein ADT71_29315 [Novosphingobium sp. ST904]TCM43225.1 Alg9-like mannosyltransferase family protein [Novosphingobium sp. ST904]